MNDFLFNILAWIRSWVGSWGWAMVVFTVMIRLVLTPLDVKSRVSWLGGTLVYSAIDLGELLGRISSIYGERITCVNSGKGSRSVSIILNIKESIPNILDAISYICPVKWTVGESGEYIVETI